MLHNIFVLLTTGTIYMLHNFYIELKTGSNLHSLYTAKDWLKPAQSL